MSQKSRLRKSRNHWKHTASERATKIRYVNREISRIKNQRNRLKEELNATKARVCELESQIRGGVVQNKVDLIYLALQLFLVARIGFRAVSRVLGVMAIFLAIEKVPCPQTIVNWVNRLSMVRIRSSVMLKGGSTEFVQGSNGLIWMIDMSIGLGTGKILTVLALDTHHHRIDPSAPGFRNVHCIAVSVADSWTGELITSFLERLIAVTGRPAAYLKDGGLDLKKAVRLLCEKGLGSHSIEDISHVIANLLKKGYGDHSMFDTFVSACGSVAGKLKQTVLACLAPPKVHTKARFMNVHRLFAWAKRLLDLSPPGRAKAGAVLSKLRACLDVLPSCRAFIKQFLSDAEPLLECQKILKAGGLSHATLEECEPIIRSILSPGIRSDFQDYLDRQFDIAKSLGLDTIGMPITSDQLESLYGLGKQHGVGEIKDADRIAIRLPALCGTPTRAEAEQVMEISVAEQKELTAGFTSLTKQRREVFSKPDRLDSLNTNQARSHVELIPSAKNRSKSEELDDISIGFHYSTGPDPQRSNCCHDP